MFAWPSASGAGAGGARVAEHDAIRSQASDQGHGQVREDTGRDPEPSAGILDSQETTTRKWRHVTHGSDDYWTKVYADEALTTQLTGGMPTSSSSRPSLMYSMLDALGVRDCDWVLEIGTGTGYNAALLIHRLGDGHVTTIDVDPLLTETAEARLASAGFRPHVDTGDGAFGVPRRAPYDKVIATSALRSVPRAVLAQTRPGGTIVAPIGWGLVRLSVVQDGMADGRFLAGGACFMPRRTGASTPRFDP